MSAKRFRIAFSFAGEKRDFVAKVAAILAKKFRKEETKESGEDKILYDKYHEAELARNDLGIYLPNLYNRDTDLVVVIICPHYDVKEWTGLEWLAIHDLLKQRRREEVLLCRFDRATVDGLYSTAGFAELDDKTPEQTATLILERLALNEGKPKEHYKSDFVDIIDSSTIVEYEHHIFLSYAHGKVWTPWIKDTFLPRLNAYLESEVGPVTVSVDYQIEPGAQRDPNLKRRVARSKIMLPLISANYFHQEWCRLEMALMFEREKRLGMAGSGDNYGLIIPVRLGDGLTFPELIGRVQYFDFEEFADPDLPSASLRASNFNLCVKKLAQTIAHTLPKVPAQCSDEWSTFTGDEFFAQLCARPLASPKPPRPLL